MGEDRHDFVSDAKRPEGNSYFESFADFAVECFYAPLTSFQLFLHPESAV